jgi:hypothetical protein
VDGRNSRRPFLDIQMPHHEHRGGKYYRQQCVGQLVHFFHSASISQWPKNNHNRMITGIGTPINQSRSPRPIAASVKPLVQNATDVGFRPATSNVGSAANKNPPDGDHRAVSEIRYESLIAFNYGRAR